MVAAAVCITRLSRTPAGLQDTPGASRATPHLPDTAEADLVDTLEVDSPDTAEADSEDTVAVAVVTAEVSPNGREPRLACTYLCLGSVRRWSA